MTRLLPALVLIALIFGAPALAQPVIPDAVTVTCRSPSVSDGDTLGYCAGEKVRIWGLNAPERGDEYGGEATLALRNLTRGQTVTCTQAQKSRSWGRLVARCVLADGRDLACEMIRGGWGTEWVQFSKGFYRECGE